MRRYLLTLLALLMYAACSNTPGTVSDTAPAHDETAAVDEMTATDETTAEADTNDEVVMNDDLNDEATDDALTGPDDTTDEISDIDEIFVPDEDIDTVSTGPCTVQFGVPNEKTGLTAEQCRPLCDCEGKFFQPPLYTEEDIAKLLAMVPVNPPAEVTEDPYDKPEEHQPVPGTVCGLFLDGAVPDGYRLETFESDMAAIAAGAYITHWDGCGVCSTLTNLVVYMRQPDLTDPVRQCGIDNMFNKDGNIECLQDLGFDLPCAQIWYYNTQHTQSKCFTTCMSAVNDPYHNPDGTLNDCLICDEVNSGPVFKAVAGRNRRNTGLPSSMCRPCAEVQPVFHYYW